MIARRLLPWLGQRCCRLASDQRGISAVEFALLMPLMLTMYFGSLEVTDAISADRQVTLVASTIADITSEYSSLASSDISNIMGAPPATSVASAVLSPFAMANAQITLTSVVIDTNGNAYVDWSVSINGQPRSGNVTSSIPSALRPSGASSQSSVIWGEATYNYKPVIGYVVTGTLQMYNGIFMRPRLSSCVQYNGSYCTGGAVNAP
jgi:Flp pilus assembly protein TadG